MFHRKPGIVVGLVALVVMAICESAPTLAAPAVSGSRFADAINHWARGDIQYLADQGFVNGYTEANGTRSIRPDNPMTRAELVKTLVAIKGITPATVTTPTFKDTAGHWANSYLAAAKAEGLAGGYPDGTFNPNGNITRAELAAFMSKGFSHKYSSGDPPFSDVLWTHWASAYITNVTEQGWIKGYTDGTFRPDQLATRAEAFTVIARVHREIEASKKPQ